MKISIIGMSNSGKSYWSEKLQKLGFKRFCVDDMIEKKLEPELKKLGFSGIHDVAAWMGQPYDSQYPETSKKYLDLERECMQEVFEYLDTSSDENLIIDTTGSVIYTGNDTIQKLAQKTLITYIDTPELVKQEMCEAYFKNPKPVIWGDLFKQNSHQNPTEALVEWYPKLLEFRTKKYKEHTHITLDYHEIRKPSFDINEFLNLVSIKGRNTDQINSHAFL